MSSEERPPIPEALILDYDERNANRGLKYHICRGNNRKCSLCWKIFALAFFALVFINCWIIHHFTRMCGLGYVMTYMTNIAMALLVIFLLVGVIHACKKRSQHDSISKLFNWLLIISGTVMLFNVIYYWCVLSWDDIPSFKTRCDSQWYCHIHNFCVHGLGLIPIALCLLCEPSKIRLKDFWKPLLVGLLFLLLLIPITIWGPELYKGFTLKNFKSYMWMVLGLLGLMLAFLAVWAASTSTHIRTFGYRLKSQCCCAPEPELNPGANGVAIDGGVNGRTATGEAPKPKKPHCCTGCCGIGGGRRGQYVPGTYNQGTYVPGHYRKGTSGCCSGGKTTYTGHTGDQRESSGLNLEGSGSGSGCFRRANRSKYRTAEQVESGEKESDTDGCCFIWFGCCAGMFGCCGMKFCYGVCNDDDEDRRPLY